MEWTTSAAGDASGLQNRSVVGSIPTWSSSFWSRFMTKKQAQELRHGLYWLTWKTGGNSLAAVGSLHDGTRWFAPTNWTSKTPEGIACTKWRCVETTIAIKTKLS